MEENKMGMTMTQKILAAHAGLDKVEAQIIPQIHINYVLYNIKLWYNHK